jgi:peptidylprolyl isomerase
MTALRPIVRPLVAVLLFILVGCEQTSTPPADVVIETELGDVYIHLYKDTPKHRDNFIKLAQQGYFNGTAFHRVINEFMIQGGDPNSRALFGTDTSAHRDSLLRMIGNGGPGYTVDAEILKGRFHKRGSLAAARLGDYYNPDRKSSGSQFYIVTGKRYRAGELDTLEIGIENSILQQRAQAYVQRPENRWITETSGDQLALEQLRTQNPDSFARLSQRLLAAWNDHKQETKRSVPPIGFTLEQRKTYVEEGGTPQLDGQYTVFGEVTSGMDIVDKISTGSTNPQTAMPNTPVPVKRVRVIFAVTEK